MMKVQTKSGNIQKIAWKYPSLLIGRNGVGKSYIAKEIQNNSHSFKVFDNFCEKCDPWVTQERVKALLKEQIRRLDKVFLVISHRRIVINMFPLENIYVITPERIYNYDDDRATYDEFKFIGLSNYDFYFSHCYEGWTVEELN